MTAETTVAIGHLLLDTTPQPPDPPPCPPPAEPPTDEGEATDA